MSSASRPTPAGSPSRRAVLGLGALGVAGVTLGSAAPAEAWHHRLRFGVIADCQYADKPDLGSRHYRASVGKLEEAVEVLNDADLRFALHLGDFIDEFPESFDVVVPIFERLRMAKYHVLGNHDFMLPREQVLETLRMPASYHHFRRDGWRFVVVDTNDVSTYGNPAGSEKHALAEEMLARLEEQGAPNAQTWNGAVGAEQLAWLERTLEGARRRGEPVVLSSHHPVYPANEHNAWNDHELVDLVAGFDNVVAWFNGHNHAGNYGFAGGTHFVTFEGMVELDSNSFAAVEVGHHGLVVEGHGREPSRLLPYGRPAAEPR
ncbi:metallophosphoesterase [Georgenia alba]|uniref:Metallophosphoesterase n=1 Tax=Georgenia alba TaxID=2233858 RepID=A0ABW2QAQ2_9MICO